MMLESNSHLLGIMVCSLHAAGYGQPPFSDRGFYRRLSQYGRNIGVEVIIFDPIETDWSRDTVRGYRFSAAHRRWVKVRRPVPAVIYDRCYYNGKFQYLRYRKAIHRLSRIPSVRCVISGLSGKWQVQQMLLHQSELRTYLPETRRLTDMRQVFDWLDDEPACILKPNAGSHGKRIVRVERLEAGGYGIKGRDSLNQPISATFDSTSQLRRWLDRFVGSRKYLLQESLTLHTETGQSFDVRSLVQKDGSGKWQLTGMAVRVGRPGSLTANIHGGGTTCPLRPFLVEHYGIRQAETIISQLTQLSRLIPPVLERHAGHLLELGIDFGIDRSGRVWILEVNSKPGRSVFTQLHDAHRSRASINNLIHYARYLFDRQLGGVTK